MAKPGVNGNNTERLTDFERTVQALLAVPKSEIDAVEASRPKRPRKPKKGAA